MPLRPANGCRKVLIWGLPAALCLLSGCRSDMQRQPKFSHQRATSFFSNERSVLPQVAGTVAREQGQRTDFLHTGLINGQEVDALPFDVTMPLMRRGQEQFNIYCSPCHSRVGNGVGMVVLRGYKPAGNLVTDPKRIAQPLGHYFVVMSEGQGAMPSMADMVTPENRWAIAAYIRALQLSRNARISDVPTGIHPLPLREIARREGLPESFADLWPMPATSITRDGRILNQEVDFVHGETLNPGAQATGAQK